VPDDIGIIRSCPQAAAPRISGHRRGCPALYGSSPFGVPLDEQHQPTIRRMPAAVSASILGGMLLPLMLLVRSGDNRSSLGQAYFRASPASIHLPQVFPSVAGSRRRARPGRRLSRPHAVRRASPHRGAGSRRSENSAGIRREEARAESRTAAAAGSEATAYRRRAGREISRSRLQRPRSRSLCRSILTSSPGFAVKATWYAKSTISAVSTWIRDCPESSISILTP
jgi:hypothetical protein